MKKGELGAAGKGNVSATGDITRVCQTIMQRLERSENQDGPDKASQQKYMYMYRLQGKEPVFFRRCVKGHFAMAVQQDHPSNRETVTTLSEKKHALKGNTNLAPSIAQCTCISLFAANPTQA